MIFCTLFDSGYLDKGLLMFRSLRKVMNDFKLYVFAFDQTCYEVLMDIQDKHLIPISLNEFETKELLEAKSNRTNQEYCWTCSCHTIKHVLEHFNEDHCTYIDADMYFYTSPQVLLDEIVESGCDVSIIEHAMPNNQENRRAISLSGKYCIEFNTFFNTANGKYILDWWCQRCLERCTANADTIYFGDQKYLDDWLDRFKGVHVIKNKGAGVAPWNIAKYRVGIHNDNLLRYRFHFNEFPLVFYHFQSMYYIDRNLIDIRVNIYPNKAQKKLYTKLYSQYIEKINDTRDELLNKYRIDLFKEQKYHYRISKKKQLKDELLCERNVVVLISKLWRIIFRKSNDYINYI